jgi:Ca2+-transporting ATPase
MENFDDPINCILLGAAIVSIVIGLVKNGFPKGMIDGVSIIIALLIICVVNSVNNWISERRLAALLNSSKVQEVAVHRGSAEETVTVDGRDLVVGDLISFASGARVPADCIMISGQDVLTDESELTGEPD